MNAEAPRESTCAQEPPGCVTAVIHTAMAMPTRCFTESRVYTVLRTKSGVALH